MRALTWVTDEMRARFATSGQLAMFLGMQDLPDAGVVLTVRAQTQSEARVHALLRYSGRDAEREFLASELLTGATRAGLALAAVSSVVTVVLR